MYLVSSTSQSSEIAVGQAVNVATRVDVHQCWDDLLNALDLVAIVGKSVGPAACKPTSCSKPGKPRTKACRVKMARDPVATWSLLPLTVENIIASTR